MLLTKSSQKVIKECLNKEKAHQPGVSHNNNVLNKLVVMLKTNRVAHNAQQLVFVSSAIVRIDFGRFCGCLNNKDLGTPVILISQLTMFS